MLKEIKINPSQKQYYLEKGYWKNSSLLDCWEESLKHHPDREYVVDDRGFRYTYREMDEAASKVAAHLFSKGIRSNDVVSYQIPIWSEFVIITIACIKAGAIAHPIAMSYNGKELIHSIKGIFLSYLFS